MRGFLDAAGSAWDVTTGKESWGTLVLLFSPRAGGDPRKTVLAVETAYDAERMLEGMSDDELRARLADSVPWA